MSKLLTQKDVAERWQLNVATIKDYRKQGILSPVRGIPAIRFTEQHIAELEGTDLKKVSPIQVKRLERELSEVREENERLRGIVFSILSKASQAIGMEEVND